MPTPTYTPLATKTLTSSASSVTFSSITGAYRDLVLVVNGAGGNGDFYPRLRFNNDTTSSYSWIAARGDGTTAASFSGTENGQQITNGVYLSISNPALIITHIMDYSATDKHKCSLTRANRANLATEMLAGRWASTAAITNIQFYSSNGNTLASGATLTLYGVAA